jgi:hypothetical protein
MPARINTQTSLSTFFRMRLLAAVVRRIELPVLISDPGVTLGAGFRAEQANS